MVNTVSEIEMERRKYQRFELPIPVEILGYDGRVLVKGTTAVISDGSLMMFISAKVAPKLDSIVEVRLSILEPHQEGCPDRAKEILCKARVVRHRPIDEGRLIGVAMQYLQPLDLKLEEKASRPCTYS